MKMRNVLLGILGLVILAGSALPANAMAHPRHHHRRHHR